jgi:hypothetical protein
MIGGTPLKTRTKKLQNSPNTWLRISSSVLLIATIAATSQAATFAVNSTADPGDGICDQTCTFRDALIAANTTPGQDRIDFSNVLAAEPVTILLASGLPVIIDSVVMDASIAETREIPGNPQRRPGIELDLTIASPVIGTSDIPFFPNGVSFFGPGASGSELRGFIINGINQSRPGLCTISFFNPDPEDTGTPALEFCSNAVAVFASDGVTIAGNYLNLDAAGEALASKAISAISLIDVNNGVIGGEHADDRNVMTVQDYQGGLDRPHIIQSWSHGWIAPAFGLPKQFNNNQFIGNYLGLTSSGLALNPFTRGIWLRNLNTEDAPSGPNGWGEQCGDQDRDPCEMRDNIISGNLLSSRGGFGTFLLSGDQEGTVIDANTAYTTAVEIGQLEVFAESTGVPVDILISSNRFGVDPNGKPLTVNSLFGLIISGGNRIMIENNIITGGLLDGVAIFDDSWSGEEPPANITLSQNSIFGNCLVGDIPQWSQCQGIDLRSPDGIPTTGPTPNDHLDSDSGANSLQNKPALLEITPPKGKGRGASQITGELDSAPNQVYLIEFFSNASLNAAERAEGERFMGQKTVSTDRRGHVDFVFNYNPSSDGELATDNGITFITATATRKHCEPKAPTCLYGSTSEFSQTCEWDTQDNSGVICTR